MQKLPMSLWVGTDPACVLPDGRREFHAVFEIEGHRIESKEARPPLTVVLLIDVSGSMTGEPLTKAVASVAHLTQLLDDTDEVAVVAFANNASVVAPLSPLTQAHRRVVVDRTGRLAANGGTNFTDALSHAVSLTANIPSERRGLVLMLTDGQPNAGSTTLSALEAELDGLVHASLCTLGYGAHHDENLLSGMARKGRGTYVFIADPLEAQTEFARIVGAQGAVVTENVELSLQLNDGVELIGFVGHAKPRFTSRGLLVGLPDLLDGQPGIVVAKLAFDAPREPGQFALIEVTARGRPRGSSDVNELSMTLSLPVSHTERAPDEHATSRVILAEAELARNDARSAADVGNFDAAAAVIGAIMKRIEALPYFVAGGESPLCQSYEQLVDEKGAYERRPSKENYGAFRKSSLSVDMQVGDAAVMSGKAADAVRQFAQLDKGPVIARLVGVQGHMANAIIPLHSVGEITAGRVQGNDLLLSDGGVSKRHTRFVSRDGKVIVVDLKTTNSTYVNGKSVRTPQVLNDGDVIYIGSSSFRFENSSS